MNGAMASQLVIIILSFYFIVRALSKMPKPIAYTVYGFIAVSTIAIFIMGFYYPETLQQWVDTVEGWQESLRGY